MKFVLWGVFALIALVWTGGAALLAQAVGWAGQAIASPEAGAIGAAAASLSVPAWLAPWVDAAQWNAAVQSIAGALTAAEGWLPALGTLVSWLVPAVWLAWGLGFVLLAALTLAGHWWIGRLGRPRTLTASPA